MFIVLSLTCVVAAWDGPPPKGALTMQKGETVAHYVDDLLAHEKERLSSLKELQRDQPKFDDSIPFSETPEMPEEAGPSSLLEESKDDILAPFDALTKKEDALRKNLAQMISKLPSPHAASLLEETPDEKKATPEEKKATPEEKTATPAENEAAPGEKKATSDKKKVTPEEKKATPEGKATSGKGEDSGDAKPKEDPLDALKKKLDAMKEKLRKDLGEYEHDHKKPSNDQHDDKKPSSKHDDDKDTEPTSFAEVGKHDKAQPFVGNLQQAKEEMRELFSKDADDMKNLEDGQMFVAVDADGNLRKA